MQVCLQCFKGAVLYQQSMLNQALKRDHYRCVLTGALDAGLVRGKIIRLDPNSVIAPENTQAVHIFPMSIWSKRNDANHEVTYYLLISVAHF